MKLYRKKPLVVEAAQWDGRLIGDMFPIAFFADKVNWHYVGQENLVIETLEGDMFVQPSDWIIIGIKGEFYAVKEQIFLESYEAAE